MFRERIERTPITGDVADSVFKINGDYWNGDDSFVATLRCLVGHRTEDPLVYMYRTIMVRKEILTLDYLCSYLDPDSWNAVAPNKLSLVEFKSPKEEDGHSAVDVMRKGFADSMPGFRLVEKCTLFFQKVMDVAVFVDPDRKSTVIFCCGLTDYRKYHYLQCGICAFLPWYFNPDDGVSELEMRLINSLRSKEKGEYLDCVAEFAKKYDFRTLTIKNLLDGFELRFEQRKLENESAELQNIIRRINSLNDEIGQYLEQKRNRELTILGLRTRMEMDKGESEIMEYFLSNKNVHLVSVTDTRMSFVVTSYLNNFDPDAAESLILNKRSCFYRPNGRDLSHNIPNEDMELLLNALFVDQTLRMRMCAAYQFVLERNVNPLGGYDYPEEFSTYTPNPHINRFNCMGDYLRIINDMVLKGDYIMAIEQCVASCGSLNFYDLAVISEFAPGFYGNEMKCIELPDGTVVDPKGAIEFLKTGVVANG